MELDNKVILEPIINTNYFLFPNIYGSHKINLQRTSPLHQKRVALFYKKLSFFYIPISFLFIFLHHLLSFFCCIPQQCMVSSQCRKGCELCCSFLHRHMSPPRRLPIRQMNDVLIFICIREFFFHFSHLMPYVRQSDDFVLPSLPPPEDLSP